MLFRQSQCRWQAGRGAVGGREPLNFVVQAVAEDAVGEGGGRRVALVAPAYD